MNNVSRIEVCWDTQDASNPGWAWYAYYGTDELADSGALNGRASCGNKTLAVRARAEAGVAGRRVPVKVTR